MHALAHANTCISQAHIKYTISPGSSETKFCVYYSLQIYSHYYMIQTSRTKPAKLPVYLDIYIQMSES